MPFPPPKAFLLTILAAVLSACAATGYQQQGLLGGGYAEKQLPDGRYEISFTANGYTDIAQGRMFSLRRAAELAQEKGKQGYVIDEGKGVSLGGPTRSIVTVRLVDQQELSNEDHEKKIFYQAKDVLATSQAVLDGKQQLRRGNAEDINENLLTYYQNPRPQVLAQLSENMSAQFSLQDNYTTGFLSGLFHNNPALAREWMAKPMLPEGQARVGLALLHAGHDGLFEEYIKTQGWSAKQVALLKGTSKNLHSITGQFVRGYYGATGDNVWLANWVDAMMQDTAAALAEIKKNNPETLGLERFKLSFVFFKLSHVAESVPDLHQSVPQRIKSLIQQAGLNPFTPLAADKVFTRNLDNGAKLLVGGYALAPGASAPKTANLTQGSLAVRQGAPWLAYAAVLNSTGYDMGYIHMDLHGPSANGIRTIYERYSDHTKPFFSSYEVISARRFKQTGLYRLDAKIGASKRGQGGLLEGKMSDMSYGLVVF